MRGEERLHGFDNWRAVLLLLGPLIHSSTSVPGSRIRWLETLVQVSHLFRMEAFFAIAGFMTLYIDGPSRSGWLSKRMRQLLLPLAATGLLLNSAAFAFVRWWDGTTYSVADPIHLWFLLDLAAGTAALCWIDRRGILPTPGRRWWLWACNWLAAVVTARAFLYLGQGRSIPCGLLTALPYYMCFFGAGAIAARTPAMTQWLRVTRLWWAGIPVLVGAIIVFNLGYTMLVDPLPGQRHTLFRLTYQALIAMCATSMSITVLATALRVRSEQPTLRLLSRGAYTVYLVHVPIILVLARLIGATHPGPTALFVEVASLSFVLSWSFHWLVVERLPLAALLFSGQFPTGNRLAKPLRWA